MNLARGSARLLSVMCAVAVTPCFAEVTPASGVMDIGTQRQLFVGEFIVGQLKDKAELLLHHPVAREISQSRNPWDMGNDFSCGSTFKDGAIYRRYYRPGWIKVDPKAKTDVVGDDRMLCYEESDDGIHWRQPNLGICEYHGSKANNIVYIGGQVGNLKEVVPMPTVFRDENPDAAPDARYKAIFWSNGPKGLMPFKSPDALHWSPMLDAPFRLRAGASVNIAFWDAERHEYRVYYRYHVKMDAAASRAQELRAIDPPVGFRRDIRTANSKDFVHWSEPSDLHYVDSPPEELYTNGVMPYYRAPQIYLGYPVRYVERSVSASLLALPDRENREMRMQVEKRFGTAISEGLIMASRDGVTFKRWNEAFLRPGIERPGTWNYGQNFIAWAPVETKSALVGAPNELSFYTSEGDWVNDVRTVRRYTIRLDGFVSAHAPMSGGELITQPLRFSGRELRINFSTSAAGGVQVELQDLSGTALPGYALNDCPVIFGDTIDRPVKWNGEREAGAVAGRAVRIRFVLHDADVYSFHFVP